MRVKKFGIFFNGIWQGIAAESRKITENAYQLTNAAAITDKDNFDRLKKLQKKSVFAFLRSFDEIS